MANMNHGTRFAKSYAVGAHTNRPDTRMLSPAERVKGDWWWTPERIEKLNYVMFTYDDIEKASRVLGISLNNIVVRWRKLKVAYFETEIKYEEDCSKTGILQKLKDDYNGSNPCK